MMGRGTLGLALAAVIATLAFGMETGRVEAAPDVLSADSIVLEAGQEGHVLIYASDLPSDGLVAWTVDFTWNPSVVEALGCVSDVSQCSTAFEANVGRITGTSDMGTEPQVTLAGVRFRCADQPGATEVVLSIEAWAYSTAAGPQEPEVDIHNGLINCVEPRTPAAPTPVAPIETPTTQPSLPPSGAGPTDDWGVPQWAMALLTAAGASLVALAALRKERAS